MVSQLFSKRLVQLRKEKNLTQQQLSDLVGFSRNTYAQYETSRREPDFDTVQILANFFEVSIDYLVGNDFNTPKEPIDLVEFLDESDLLFNGIPITKEYKIKIKAALDLIFWDEKQKEKQQKS